MIQFDDRFDYDLYLLSILKEDINYIVRLHAHNVSWYNRNYTLNLFNPSCDRKKFTNCVNTKARIL